MGRIIRVFLIGVRFVTPWIFRVAWFSLRMAANAFVAWWVGTPKIVANIVENWHGVAVASGFPTRYDSWLHWGATITAYIMLILGWIIAAYVTVWIIGFLIHK